MNSNRRGSAFLVVFLMVATLGWTAGSVTLGLENQRIARAEAERARAEAERKQERINFVELNWHKASTAKRDWTDVSEASGEVILQQAYVGGGTCPTKYRCTDVFINPKFACTSLSVTVEWRLRGNDKLLERKKYNLGWTSSMQVFKQHLDATVLNDDRDSYYDMISATCEGKRYE